MNTNIKLYLCTMKVNIHFNNQNIKRVPELYLFYRIRRYALNNGGWFNGFIFSHNEQYRVLPKLRKLGWIHRKQNMVFKYRSLLNRFNCLSLFTKIEDEHLITLNAFKGYLLACGESYTLNKRHKIIAGESYTKNIRDNNFEKKYWDEAKHGHSMYRVKKISSTQFGNPIYIGRAFNKELCDLLECDRSTVSRWRNFSKKAGFNTYYYDVFRLDKPADTKKREMLQKGRCFEGEYSPKHKGMVIKDLVIKTSDIFIHIDKHYQGYGRI